MKNITPRFAPLFAALALACTAGLTHAAANLVQNGSFETGNFNAWQTVIADASTSYVDSSLVSGPVYNGATDGSWLAWFGSSAGTGGATLSQALSTVASGVYTLSFDLANANGIDVANNAFSASIDGTAVQAFLNLGNQDYRHYQVNFTATGNSTQLSLNGSTESASGYLQLDNVQVSAVPEPSTALLTLVGLVGVGGFMRRKHRAA